MNPTERDLRENYQRQETEELLFIASKELTEIARTVLYAELATRGLTANEIELARSNPEPELLQRRATGSLASLAKLAVKASPARTAEPPKPITRPATWEWLVVALIVIGSLVQLGSLVLIIWGSWDLTRDSLVNGTMSWWVFSLPLFWFSGVAMLSLMRKWALPLITVHLIASIAYAVALVGFKGLTPITMLGYCLEALVVFFCLHLLGKGRLR